MNDSNALHEWQRDQKRVIKQLKAIDIGNCLEYAGLHCNDKDWSNIPLLVAKYIIHLEKYLSGLSSVCYEFNEREHVGDLRSDMEDRIQRSLDKIDANRDVDLKEKGEMNAFSKVIEGHHEDLKEDYETFRHKAEVFRDRQHCNQIFQKYMIDVMAERDGEVMHLSNDGTESQEPPIYKRDEDLHKNEGIGLEELKNVRNQYRLFTFHQLRDITLRIMDNSVMNDRMKHAQKNIVQLFSHVDDLKEEDLSIRAYIDQSIQDVRNELAQSVADQEVKNQQNIQRFEQVFKVLKDHQAMIQQMQSDQRQMRMVQDGHTNHLKKTNDRLDALRNEVTTNIEIVKQDFRDRISDIDKFYSDNIDDMSKQLEKVKILARDSVNNKERELSELLNQQSKQLQNFVDDNVDEMVRERKTLVQKNEKQFKEIKLVCSKFFEVYDTQLKEVKMQSEHVMKKYENWSKVLIEPSSLNDARLYALETWVSEEEGVRIKENEFIRAVMRKFVYSMEQSMGIWDTILPQLNIKDPAHTQEHTADNSQSPDMDKTKTSELPYLPNNKLPGKKGGAFSQSFNFGSTMTDKSKSMLQQNSIEASNPQVQKRVLKKRLNYLKSELDTQNKFVTKFFNKEKAEESKKQRIFELWQKELKEPSVKEMVSSMSQSTKHATGAANPFDFELLANKLKHGSQLASSPVIQKKKQGELSKVEASTNLENETLENSNSIQQFNSSAAVGLSGLLNSKSDFNPSSTKAKGTRNQMVRQTLNNLQLNTISQEVMHVLEQGKVAKKPVAEVVPLKNTQSMQNNIKMSRFLTQKDKQQQSATRDNSKEVLTQFKTFSNELWADDQAKIREQALKLNDKLENRTKENFRSMLSDKIKGRLQNDSLQTLQPGGETSGSGKFAQFRVINQKKFSPYDTRKTTMHGSKKNLSITAAQTLNTLHTNRTSKDQLDNPITHLNIQTSNQNSINEENPILLAEAAKKDGGFHEEDDLHKYSTKFQPSMNSQLQHNESPSNGTDSAFKKGILKSGGIGQVRAEATFNLNSASGAHREVIEEASHQIGVEENDSQADRAVGSPNAVVHTQVRSQEESQPRATEAIITAGSTPAGEMN